MKIINFSHPLTQDQLRQIEDLVEQSVDEVIEVPSQIEPKNPLAPQIEAMLASTMLSKDEWRTLPLLINLPALNYSAALMLTYLHGWLGYFPAVLRLRPVVKAVPLRFEVAEIINLQVLRDNAREKRQRKR